MTDNNKQNSDTHGFSLTTGVFVVFSSMVGTGILTTSGFTVASVGSHQWAWMLWVIGGILAICGALVQAELVTRIPSSGGDYAILSSTYGPLTGFLSGWVSLVLGFAGPIAASSKAAARYFLSSFSQQSIVHNQTAVAIIATSLVLLLSWLHSHSHQRSSLTQNLASLIKVFFLIGLMSVGIIVGFAKSELPSDWPTQTNSGLIVQSLTSLIYINYAYTGWNSIGYIAGDMKNPQRNLPLSIIIGTIIVICLYLGLNLFYGLALSANEIKFIAEQRGFDALAPIAELSAAKLFGPDIASILSLIISLMLIASVSAYILTGSRIIQAMAQNRQFPVWASQANTRGVPVRATFIQLVITLFFVWSASLESIIVISGIGLALFSMLTIASIFRIRATSPNNQTIYRCPLFPVTPIVYLIGTSLLVTATIWNRPTDGIAAIIAILIGLVAYGFSFALPRHRSA